MRDLGIALLAVAAVFVVMVLIGMSGDYGYRYISGRYPTHYSTYPSTSNYMYGSATPGYTQSYQYPTSYTYSSATIRQAHGSAGMQVSFVVGLQEDVVYGSFVTRVDTAAVIILRCCWNLADIRHSLSARIDFNGLVARCHRCY